MTVFRSGEFLSPVPRGVARQSVNVKLYFHALQICNVGFFWKERPEESWLSAVSADTSSLWQALSSGLACSRDFAAFPLKKKTPWKS